MQRHKATQKMDGDLPFSGSLPDYLYRFPETHL